MKNTPLQRRHLLVPPGFDCAKIRELGIDKQENLRAGAIMIACGEAEGGSASPGDAFSQFVQELLQSSAYGTTDIDLITGAESNPNVTQSETFTASNPDNHNQIVVAYNDSRGRNASPINISGASVSTDGRYHVYRNNVFLVNTQNDGAYTDTINGAGHATFTYRVCEVGTRTCSNNATMTF